MTKRPNNGDLAKLEEFNDGIKRQIPSDYQSSPLTTTTTTTPILHHPSMALPQTLPPSLAQLYHNGLDATQQMLQKKQDEESKLTDRVKSITPPCKNCGGNKDVIEDERAGAYICTACGLETGRIIIETAEWRNFGDGKGDPSRVTAEDKFTGLENVVRSEGANGRKPPEQRRMAAVTQHLDGLRTALRTSDSIFYNARKLAEQYISGPIDIIGSNVKAESLAAVVFHAAALDLGFPVRKEDILVVSQLSQQTFNRYQKRLNQVRTEYANKNDKDAPVNDPVREAINYMTQYAKKLNCSKQTIDAASCIISTTFDLNIGTGSKAPTIAAAVLLFTLNLQERGFNEHELVRQSSTSLSTLRQYAAKLYGVREHIVPEGFVEQQRIITMPNTFTR